MSGLVLEMTAIKTRISAANMPAANSREENSVFKTEKKNNLKDMYRFSWQHNKDGIIKYDKEYRHFAQTKKTSLLLCCVMKILNDVVIKCQMSTHKHDDQCVIALPNNVFGIYYT